MKIPYFCCIGAELKRYAKDFDFMNQVYLYKVPTDDTMEEVLAQDYFQAVADTVLQDDIVYIYEPTTKMLYMCHFNKQNGHITAEQMSNNIPTLTPDKILISDATGHITVGDISLDFVKNKLTDLENIGDMDLPVITEGGTAPTNLSEAIRQIVTQNLTLSEDSVEPQSGQFSLWGAIKKALGNAKNFFSSISDLDTRLNALEGQGGPVGSYDFGKSFPNILDATDTQLVAGVMVDNIWAGHTPIVWTTPIANSTFTDGDGVDRTVGEIFNGTWIINSYDGTRIVLTNTPNTTPPIFSYQNVGVYSVGFANATTAGVVRVGTGSDMTVDQNTGDISIDDTKGYSIFHRLISLFTGTQKTQIREDLNAASRDMDDLSATGQNIGLWCNNAANIITEIPQDIKLELNNGTLTLKAGSKCYLKTDTTTPSVNIASDLTTTQTTNGTYFAIYNGSVLTTVLKTTYDYSSLPSTYSLPLAVVTVSDGAISSIDQIFNGFGYIGSTVFALPRVKGLIPNGRNADGTLNNINFTVENVTTKSLDATGWHGMWSFYFNQVDSAVMIHPTELEYISDSKPSGIYTSTAFWYSPSENKLYYTQDTGSTWTQVAYVRIDFTETAQQITSIDIEYPFRAVGYRDTEFIANCAMPSKRYTNLTVGASGTQYTAPAEGYFLVRATAPAAGRYLELVCSGSLNSLVHSGGSNIDLSVFVPVSKGFTVTLNYTTNTPSIIRFIYDNGSI